MDIFSVLTMLGGLAMTLFGMNVMSSGLERLSGGVLERTLEKTTSSRFKGVVLGAAVTALIQSSSATTVMTVGFVNSGIMQLNQAVGIIMGANIGTTITAWILSLSGISGESVMVRMMKPSSFSPILALIGVALLLFSKKEKRKNTGSILCGFAVLMFGMSTMSDAMAPLADMPEFTRVMTMFENPILGLLVGAGFTGIIQSSAAAVGILQALSITGAITYGAAIPLIMGQNIGTCVTALLSCIGASNNARRTAMVHLYFNMIGTIVFMLAFFGGNAIFKFPFMDQPLNAADIAIVHTVFNLVTTTVLYPFANQLARLAEMTVPEDKKQPKKGTRLDDRFLSMPAFALEQCRHTTCDMAKLAYDTILMGLDLLENFDKKKVEQIAENEERIDHFEDRLGDYLVKLSCQKLLPRDSRLIGEYLHVIGDFERIGDHALNLTEVAQEIYDKKITFSDAANRELPIFRAAVREVLDLSFNAFWGEDVEMAKRVEPLEEVIDGLKAELRSRHIQRLQKGACTIELGFVLSDLLTNLERIADHCSNIAVCLIQTSEDAFDMHSYLENLKADSNGKSFAASVKEYGQKYALPENVYVD